MAPRADLTGQVVDGWTVNVKAPAQNRVPFWSCVHEACGQSADLPHVSLTKAIAGKGKLPACTTCVPADGRPRIDHGMHLACGTAHLIGTACPDGVQREPGPSTGRVPATVTGELPRPVWDQFSERDAEDYRAPYQGHPLENTPPAAPEPAAQLADAETGAVVIHGRVDRLEEPQAVLDVIRKAIVETPRSQQDALGPSEYGGCERKLGHRLALGKSERDPDGAWRPQVGTAVHAWLDDVFQEAHETRPAGSERRWLSDIAVTTPVAGTLDLFDIARGQVIDFKVSGETVRNKAAKGEVSERYETQLDLYGLGMVAAGYHVESVALLFLPPAGSLNEAVWYSRPFDPSRAIASIERHNRVKALLAVRPFEQVLARLSTSDDYCPGCPALGRYCKGAETAWIPGGLPDSAWPAYDAAVKALGGAA